jgi:hypothetical protein
MSIPTSVAATEKIVRGIFTPLYFDEKKSKIKATAFRSPPEKDEVSVLRLDYTTANFCKKHCVEKLQNPSSQKTYYGLAVFYASKVYDIKAKFNYTPLENLPMHVDISFGYVAIKGEPLPVELRIMIDELIENVKFHKDVYINSETWDCGELDCPV